MGIFYWLLVVLVLGYIAGKRTTIKKTVPSAGPHEYDLHTFLAPRVSGFGLRFVATVLEIPIISNVLIFVLFRRNKFHTLRTLQINASPTFYPLIHDFIKDTEIDQQTKLSAEEFLSRELRSVSHKPKHKGVVKPVSEYAQAYSEGKICPSDVAQKVILQVKSTSPKLNYVSTFNEADILNQARAADARIQNGTPLSIFDGVPVLVKDEFNVKGLTTQCGTIFSLPAATEDATIAQRLRSMGAIIIGKSNMVEIGISTKGVNPHHGTPSNPYSRLHHTGGSSSGAAATVASGLMPFATGADMGGSIRIPSSLCGVVGLKPTFGRVSHHGCFPITWSLGHAGPIASSVRDCSLGYAVLAGADKLDSNTEQQPPVIIPNFDHIDGISTPLQGMRVGVYPKWFNHAEKEIVRNCRMTIDVLASLGATIVDVTLLDGFMEYTRLAHTIVLLAELKSCVARYFDSGPTRNQLGLDSRVTLAVTRPFTSLDYLQANCIRTLAIQSVKNLFQDIDVLVTPTTASTAPVINTNDGKEEIDVRIEALLMRFVFLGNFVGIPSISLPCGYTPEGLPIGLQVMGRWWEEHVILKVAHALERNIEKRAPALMFNHW